MNLLAAMLMFVTLHQIDGREVDINPKTVTRMQEPRDEKDPKKQLHPKVNCVVHFLDGSYLSVAETCTKVRDMIGDSYH